MKMNEFFAGAIVALALLATPMDVSAQTMLNSECGAGPSMYRYDAPRNAEGVLMAFAGSFDIPTGESLVAQDPILTEIICLRDDESDMHVLNVAGGPGIAMPSRDSLIGLIQAMDAEVMRAVEAYAPQITGAGS